VASDFEKMLSDLLGGNNRVSKYVHVNNKHRKNVHLICHKCGASITPGSFVYRKPTLGRYGSKTSYYHLACWLELWMDF